VQVFGTEDVNQLLDMPSCIRAVEEAFRLRGAGAATPSAIAGLELAEGSLHAKMASLPLARAYAAVKVNANVPSNPVARGLPTIQGVLVLFDATTGVPLAVMDSASITTLRTAAASAVAAKYLARPDASTVTFIGCGVQARAHLAALVTVRTVRRVRAVDGRAAAVEAFCAFARDRCGLEADVAPSLREATLASDIIVTSTPSTRAILDIDDVAPGTFIAAVGADNEHKQEISPALLGDAVVIVDDVEQCARLGDLHHAIAAGVMEVGDVRASLDQVVSATRLGRANERERIVFDSTGVAIEDVAAAALVFERFGGMIHGSPAAPTTQIHM